MRSRVRGEGEEEEGEEKKMIRQEEEWKEE